MDALQSGLWLGLQTAIEPVTLLYCFIGVFLGTLIGVIPGIGVLAAISLLLPVTYHLPTVPAIVMLAGVFYGSQYGNSITSILLNLPGTPSSAVTCLDGSPMAKNGQAGLALFTNVSASFMGSVFGILVLVLFAPAIAALGLEFGPPEYFAVMLLGLVAASTMGGGSIIKGLAMVTLGLLLGTVGIDINSGISRFSFGVPQLFDGINIVALAMGVFGVTEVINGAASKSRGVPYSQFRLHSLLPKTAKEVTVTGMPILRGSCIGSFFGTLPGTGAGISSFIAYAMEKRMAKEPERFGKGAVEGVAAPESANNAAAITAFVPTLTLGIPGDVVMALVLGAMILHGVQPGPMLMSDHPDLFWGLIVSFGLGSLMLIILNLPLIKVWVTILRIPFRYLYPAILIFIALGVYSVSASLFDIAIVAGVGVLGYGMLLARFNPAPLLLGFVLGPLLEENFRRSLMLSHGDLSTFISRPISSAFLAACAALLVWSASSWLRRRRRHAKQATA